MRNRIKEETQLKAYPQKNGFIANIKKDRMTYLLILPAILLVLAFGYIPMIGIILAFNDFDIMTEAWIGAVCLAVCLVCAVGRLLGSKCPHCGKLRLTGGAYCAQCGKRIE